MAGRRAGRGSRFLTLAVGLAVVAVAARAPERSPAPDPVPGRRARRRTRPLALYFGVLVVLAGAAAGVARGGFPRWSSVERALPLSLVLIGAGVSAGGVARLRKDRDEHAWELWREVATGFIAGSVLAFAFNSVSNDLDDDRAERAERLENLRFVRETVIATEDRPHLRRFRGIDLRGMAMTRLPLGRADLVGADRAGAQLQAADLVGALLDRADLSGADLAFADISGADALRTDLSGANLYSANLSGAILLSADLSGAYLLSANLSWTVMEGADLSGADLRSADLRSTILVKANLAGADLSFAMLSEKTVLRPDGTVEVMPTQLTGVYYDDETRWPSRFRPPPSRDRP